MTLKRALIIAIIMAAPCLLASTNENKTNLNPTPIKLIEDNRNNLNEAGSYHILGVKEAPSANITVIEDCLTTETTNDDETCAKIESGKRKDEGVAIIFVGIVGEVESTHNVQAGDSYINIFLYNDYGSICFQDIKVGDGASVEIPIYKLGNQNYRLVVEADDLSKTNLYSYYRLRK